MKRQRVKVVAVALCALVTAASWAGQPTPLVVTVIDEVNRRELPNAELGFKFVDRTAERAPNAEAADTLTVALERVVFELPQVVTREPSQCGGEDADSLAKMLSVRALEQLRLGAERYEGEGHRAASDGILDPDSVHRGAG